MMYHAFMCSFAWSLVNVNIDSAGRKVIINRESNLEA